MTATNTQSGENSAPHNQVGDNRVPRSGSHRIGIVLFAGILNVIAPHSADTPRSSGVHNAAHQRSQARRIPSVIETLEHDPRPIQNQLSATAPLPILNVNASLAIITTDPHHSCRPRLRNLRDHHRTVGDSCELSGQEGDESLLDISKNYLLNQGRDPFNRSS